MQKVVIISKDTEWTRKLVNNIKIKHTWLTSIDKNILNDIDPDWIFFFHWSHIVDKSIYFLFSKSHTKHPLDFE